MKPKEPELDRFGFPLPHSFDDVGPAGEPVPKGTVGRRIRFVLRMAIVAALVTYAWNHYDLGSKLRDGIADHLRQEAIRLYLSDDLHGALATADRAVSWSPENTELLIIRAQLRRINKDYAGCLSDAELAAKLKPTDHDAQSLRRQMYHYLHEHRKVVDVSTELLTDSKEGSERAILLNDRAYARALGDFELNEALADIDEALSLSANDNSSLIDTRAYVLFRLKKYPEAIKEFDRAIGLTEKAHLQLEQVVAGGNMQRRNWKEYNAQLKMIEETLAVMYHHRGEVYEQQGKTTEAKKDFGVAAEFGFNPEAGVY